MSNRDLTEQRMQAKDIPDSSLLALLHAQGQGAPFAYRVLYDAGVPTKVVEAKFQRFYRRGWIEYGVSLRTGWLTAKGKEALRTSREATGVVFTVYWTDEMLADAGCLPPRKDGS